MKVKDLMRRQVKEKLNQIGLLKEHTMGIPSWVSYIRKALGMTAQQLADRADLALSTVYQFERGEVEGNVNLSSLKKLGDAMGCDLVYALVPREELNIMIDRQALKRAKEIISESHLHMELEDQSLKDTKVIQENIESLKSDLKDSKTLWNKS